MLTPSNLSLDFNRWVLHMNLDPVGTCKALGIARATFNRLAARKRTEGIRVYTVSPSLTMRLLMTALQRNKTLASTP